MWQPQVEHFKDRYECILPDLWGHGRTCQIPDGISNLADVAESHASLLRQATTQPSILVGLSVGGMWATELALAYPELVKGLVLMGTSVAPEPEDSRARYMGMLNLVEQVEAVPDIIVEKLGPLFFSPYTMANQPQLLLRFKQRLALLDRDTVPSIVALGRMIFSRRCLMDRLAELEIPVLIVVGADDRSRPVRESEAMVERIPNARLAVIPQAGHICNLEQPDRVNGILADFFRELA